MTDPEIQRFSDYLAAERGFSDHTSRAYLQDIAQFCGYLERGPAALVSG